MLCSTVINFYLFVHNNIKKEDCLCFKPSQHSLTQMQWL